MRTDESHLRGWTVSRSVLQRNWLIGAGVTALVLVVVLLAATGSNDPRTSEQDTQPAAVERDPGSADETTVAASTVTSTTPLVATTETGEVAPPKKKSTSTKTTSGSTSSGTGTPSDDGLTEEERQYLHDTREVVETNAEDLEDVLDAVTVALSSGDSGALQDLMATDEPEAGTYATDLAERYPPMLAAEVLPQVGVYSAGGTTVYFAYQIVTWRDAGIESTHTIAVVFRFVNGEWQLTTLGETAADLQFVQTVEL